ncbi:MlaD family protein [Fibrobacter sp. UWB11]|uniref:MlaD family protein n=1 Tax=Fibrobacter sp. UWB11 TaxID=1896202 RepID=UPI000929F2B6|nr:MlaD family protein [Fibrobacter sp. UWB11]SIO40421.1 phospholipid/cholesterol/gamma-HCH transport system substrate-binding protein [Fibrobacter sp. UWB11]
MAFQKIKQINWMEMSGLLVGVISTVAIMIFSLVLYHYLFNRVIKVKEYRLHSTFEKALGLRPGTRVQISGVEVGQITDMQINDDGMGVLMEFSIRQEFQNLITDSATVYAIRDQNLISARVVNIDIKKGKGRVLQDGDFIIAGKAQDIETVLETTNELLGRVNTLIDAANTLVDMALDTGTTMGALFGSRNLYDNLNRQLYRLDEITFLGKNVLKKTSYLLDTMKTDVPQLVSRANEVTNNVGLLLEDFKPLPNKVTTLLNSMDSTVGRVDHLVTDFGTVTTGLQDFMNTTESTLQSADDLMNGMSKMWLLRGNVPTHDSVPFVVETLW